MNREMKDKIDRVLGVAMYIMAGMIIGLCIAMIVV